MEWIDIKKQAPDEGQKVWAYFECTGIDIMEYHDLEGTEDEIFGKHLFTSNSGFLTDDVTHWAIYNEGDPIPEKPITQ